MTQREQLEERHKAEVMLEYCIRNGNKSHDRSNKGLVDVDTEKESSQVSM